GPCPKNAERPAWERGPRSSGDTTASPAVGGEIAMQPEHTNLAAHLVAKYAPRFAHHLQVAPDLEIRLRYLIDLVVSEAMFAERWGDLVDPDMLDETTPQLRLAFAEEATQPGR